MAASALIQPFPAPAPALSIIQLALRPLYDGEGMVTVTETGSVTVSLCLYHWMRPLPGIHLRIVGHLLRCT